MGGGPDGRTDEDTVIVPLTRGGVPVKGSGVTLVELIVGTMASEVGPESVAGRGDAPAGAAASTLNVEIKASGMTMRASKLNLRSRPRP